MSLANQLYGANQETEPNGPTETDPTVKTEAETTTTEAEEPTTANPPQNRRVKAELDGKEFELEVHGDIDPELIPKSFMFEKAFRQKTMALADEMRDVQGLKSKIDQQLVELNDQIQFELKELESDEMQQLKRDYPSEFESARLKVESKLSKLKQYSEERGKELADQQKQVLDADRATIPDVIPEWIDEKSMKEDYSKMGEFLKSYGIAEESLPEVFQSAGTVTLATLRKAALYDEIQAASVNVSRTAPKTSEPNSTVGEAPKVEKSFAEILYGSD